MEWEIKQDFKITWKPFWVFAGIVIALMACAAGIAIASRRWDVVGVVLAAIAFIAIFGRDALKSGLRDSEAGPKWMAGDAGMWQSSPEEQGEVIQWSQIRKMRWVRFNGLIVGWVEEDKHRAAKFKKEFGFDWVYRQYRTVLRVEQHEATKLILFWKEHGGQAASGS